VHTGEVILTITDAARIGATNALGVAFDMGSLSSNIERVTIINRGEILGAGGKGGNGGTVCFGDWEDGGTALKLTTNLIIDNTDGHIFAGGGGSGNPGTNILNTCIAGTFGQGFSGGTYAAPGSGAGAFGEQAVLVDGYGTHIGGDGGVSINKNGFSITFIGGNNAANIKGIVVD
jgi:hypothetical protein